jgi:uncharacterized membrane protein YccC
MTAWRKPKLPAIKPSGVRYAFRVMVAGLLAYGFALALSLPQGYWAVITAIVVMQSTVGGSLKAALDRLTGTAMGAAVGFCVAVLHLSGYAAGIALAAVLGPLAYAASANPRFRVAPMTAAIMLIGTGGPVTLNPVAAAIDRVLEIALGGVIGVLVALFIAPARAEQALTTQLAELLRLFSKVLAIDSKAICGNDDRSTRQKINDEIRQRIAAADNFEDEARRESSAHLTDETQAGPLFRTTRRLRTNLLLIGRAVSEPWPDHAREALAPAIEPLFDRLSARLLTLADAMQKRRSVPFDEALDTTLDAFDVAVQRFRANPASDGMAADDLSRIFTLAFAIDQFRRDTRDLTDRLNERAGSAPAPQD